ncbi:MAG: hypothetical protein HQK52_24120 [Oligoflexia bacterium]|nr:hypothetical protein [Oligoflexia bacterium]
MGHSILEYKDKYLRLHDVEIEVLVYILDEMYKRSKICNNLQPILDDWLATVKNSFPGGSALNLSLISPELFNDLIKLIDYTMGEIRKLGDFIDKDLLNKKVEDSPIPVFQTNYRTERLLNVLKKFRALLTEESS